MNNFKLEVALDYVCCLIEKERVISKKSEKYIGYAKEFCNEVKKSLDSIIHPEQHEKYHLIDNLKEIIQAYGKNPSNSEHLNELKNNFSSAVIQLDGLRSYPKKFYNTENSRELFNLFNQVKNVFAANYETI